VVVIAKDTHLAQGRRGLLRRYFDMTTMTVTEATVTWLTSSKLVVVHRDPAAKSFLDRAEEQWSVGFQEVGSLDRHPGRQDKRFIIQR
jgi:hypothetical protein